MAKGSVCSMRQQPEARQAVHDDRLIAIGQLEQLEDHAGDADGVQVGVLRVFHVGVFLRDRRR